MYCIPRPRALMKSISAAPLRACPIRWNISLTLARIVFEPSGVAARLQRQPAPGGGARRLRLLQGVVAGDPALRHGGGAGGETGRQGYGDEASHAPNPNTDRKSTRLNSSH